MCCDEVIDLGCVNSCDDVVTPIALIGTDTYYVRFMFNNSLIERVFTTTGVGGFMEVPASVFNEFGPVTFSIYDSQDEFINCYKFNVSPKTTVTEDTELITSLSSSVEYVSESCDGTYTNVILQVLLSDYTLFNDDAVIYFRVNKSIPTEARFTNQDGSSIITGSTSNAFTIPDASGITGSNMFLVLHVANAGCASQIAIEISVLNYSGLIDGVSVGTNSVLTFTTESGN